jgi:hypothetical protein
MSRHSRTGKLRRWPAGSSTGWVLTEVSDHLGNTPTVARNSYADPRVIDQFERGRTIERAIRRAGSDNLGRSDVPAALRRTAAIRAARPGAAQGGLHVQRSNRVPSDSRKGDRDDASGCEGEA